MHLAFVVTGPGICGGINVIFEHAIRMHQHGITITMLTPQPINIDDLNWHPKAIELQWLTYAEAENGAVAFDGVIATAWPTCYDLAKFNGQHYLYFNQSVESWFYAKEDWLLRRFADAAYLLPLKLITEATWIQSYLREHYGIAAELVLNGIRKDLYTEHGAAYASREPGRLRVLIEGGLELHYKNMQRTVELCRASQADEIWLLTSSAIQEYPGVDRVFSRIPVFETPNVYRSCDVLVKLSYVEGMFGPPLEMFHCGGTAIVYDVYGHDEYIRHDENGLVVRMHDEDQVVASINTLKDTPDVLDRLKAGARQTAANWHGWEHASKEFEEAIQMWLQRPPSCTQKELTIKTRLLQEWHEKTRQQSKQCRKQQKKRERLIHSKEYVIGKTLLAPARWIKHTLQRKN